MTSLFTADTVWSATWLHFSVRCIARGDMRNCYYLYAWMIRSHWGLLYRNCLFGKRRSDRGEKARWEFKYSGGVTGMSKHSSKGRKLLNCHFLNCILHYRLPFKHKVDVVSWQTRTFAFARYYNDRHLDDKRLNHYFLKVSQSEASRLGRKLRDIFGFSLGKLTMVWL